MILDIALTCIGGYIVLGGLVIVLRKDTIWRFQQERRMGVGHQSQTRTPQWDAAMTFIGSIATAAGALLLAVVWLL
jgi:hypothetical protein